MWPPNEVGLTPRPPSRSARRPGRAARTCGRPGRGCRSRGRPGSARAARRARRWATMRPWSSTTTCVGQRDRGQPVGDDQRRAALHHLAQRQLDPGLGVRVDRRGGVVQDQDPRVHQQRAGDRDPLALAARERQAALADARVVAVGQVADELVSLRPDRRRARSARAWPQARRRRCSRPRWSRTGTCPG